MSTFGRAIGHGMGILFMGLGALFIVLGVSDAFTNWLDANSTCVSGNCGADSARSTFLFVGLAFFVSGLITSVATEFAIRKTQRLMKHVGEYASNPATSVEGLSEFLEPFGIDLQPGTKANVNVGSRVIDLRGQRHGRDVPTDPAGLSDYLKSVGVSIDENLLRNATVMQGGEVVQPAQGPSASNEPTAARPVSIPSSRDELERETATIVRKHDRGETAGSQRLLELELEVLPAGRVPYRVKVASLVRSSLAGLLIEGSTLNVRVDPHDRNSVTIDWSEN